MLTLKDLEIIISHCDLMDGMLQLEQLYDDRFNSEDDNDKYKTALKRMKYAVEDFKRI